MKLFFFSTFPSTYTYRKAPAHRALTNSLRSMSIDVTSQWSNMPLIKILSSETKKKEHNDNDNANQNAVHYINHFNVKCVTFRKSIFEKWLNFKKTEEEKSAFRKNFNMYLLNKHFLLSVMFAVDSQQCLISFLCFKCNWCRRTFFKRALTASHEINSEREFG